MHALDLIVNSVSVLNTLIRYVLTGYYWICILTLLSAFSVVLEYKQDLEAFRPNSKLLGRDISPKCRLIGGEERLMVRVSHI